MSADLTQILTAIDRGDSSAAEKLMPMVYDELRKLAAARLSKEEAGQTLQATALVHEAYLRLLGPEDGEQPRYDNRGHFFAAAAESMRRILIERARKKGAVKRGGDRQRVELDPESIVWDDLPAELIDLDDALNRLAQEDPVKAQLVTLRFFGGLKLREAAAALGLTPTTADRHYSYARAWLYAAMHDEE